MMRSSLKGVALAAIAVFAPVVAQAATFTLEKVMVRGRVADTVTAISHGGIVGGSFTDKAGDHPGFLLNNGALTVLRPRYFYQGQRLEPSSIQDNGLVSAISDQWGLIWNNGRFEHHGGIGVGRESPFGRRYLGINQHHVVAFTEYIGDGQTQSYVGRKSPYPIIYPCGFDTSSAINREGVVSGECTTVEIDQEIEGIFTYDRGKTTVIQGPGNTQAYDGLINDHGAIAGRYVDAAKGLHGMILRNGKYTTFDAPSPPKEMRAVAFSNTDIVVGTYTDASGADHAYSWHKGVFSDLVKASPTVAVTVTGVSDAGDVTLNLEDVTTGVTTPYIAHCHGKDC